MVSFVSIEAVKPLAWCLRFGYWLNCLPFAWGGSRLENISSKRCRKYILGELCHLLRHGGVSLYMLLLCKWDPSVTPLDIIMACFFVCIFIISATAHSVFLCHPNETKIVINESLLIIETRGMYSKNYTNFKWSRDYMFNYSVFERCLTVENKSYDGE